MATPGGSVGQPPELFVDPLTGEPLAPPQPEPTGSPWPGALPPGQQLPGAPPPRRNRRPLVAGAIVLAVATVIGIGVLAGVSGSRSSTTLAAPSTSASRHRPPTTTTTPPVSVSPSVPGWRGVPAVHHGAAYDVPPTWKVESPDTVTGFDDENGDPLVTMSGVGTYRSGFCAGHVSSYRAQVGFSRTGLTDVGQAATTAAHDWADAGYRDEATGRPSHFTVGPPKPVSLDGGRITGVEVVTAVTVVKPGPCDGPSAQVTTVAVPLPGGGLTVFVALVDQGVPDALPPGELEKIIPTIRPLHR